MRGERRRREKGRQRATTNELSKRREVNSTFSSLMEFNG